jgi:DNA-binding NarL/FixJ family response regulator
MQTPQRALVVDDLAGSRDWLARALALAFPGIVVDQAASLAQALRLIDPPPPLALIDLGLPDGSGVQLIEALRAQPAGHCLCIVATVFDDDAHLFPALRAGAEGYVLKDQSPENLAEMLRGIADGQPPLSPSIARRLLRHFQPLPQPEETGEALTARETDVLRLVAKGLTVGEVAGMLELSRHTVAGYLKAIYRKLSVNSRAEAALEATRRGLVGHGY